MKKNPAHEYYKKSGRVPIIGTMASECRLRSQQYLKQGCNGFDNKIPTSTPIAFWTEQDVLKYVKVFGIPYASVYGEIIQNKDGKYYNEEGHYIYGMGHALPDMLFHGWTGNAAKKRIISL